MFVITGGGTGIGKSLAKMLASRNKSVLIIGRRESLLEEVANFSSNIRYIVADVSTDEGREKICEYLKSETKLEGLVHNAGVIDPIASIKSIQESDWNKTFAINIGAPLFLTQRLYNKLINGRVLNISSGVAHFPVVGWAAYCVSKAGLYMLTQSWQLECPEIAFSSVCPGIIDTDMQTKIRDTDVINTNFYTNLKNKDALIAPETVALFLSWLLLDISNDRYSVKEWDIYDTSHHQEWLPQSHRTPSLDGV